MKKHLIAASFISSGLFSLISYASPCSPEDIEDALEGFGLDGEIITNQELLEEIGDKYGDSLSELLIKEHPYLSAIPSGKIDAATLDWIQEAIWRADHRYARYVFVPGTEYDPDAWDYIMGHFIQGFNEKKRRMIATFPTQEMQQKFKSVLLNDESIREYILKNYPTATHEGIERLVVELRKYFIEFDNTTVGFSSLNGHKNPVIQLSGHGLPTNPNIAVGDELYTVQQVVQQLKSLDLPSNATIKMNICFAACQNVPIQLPKDIVLDMFFAGNLNQLADGDSLSLLTLLSNEISTQIPSFKGQIQGYLGAILSQKMDGVWSKSHGFQIKAHAVKILTTEGYILLRQKDSRVTVIFY